MRTTILLTICSFCSLYSVAQTAEDSVRLTIDKLFAAMKASDAKALKECFADSAILQTIAISKEGKVRIRNEDVAGFVKEIAASTKDDLDERITFETVKIDAALASVWTPYNFYYKGAFSHCGTNSFQLVRLNAMWKIQYIIDTRRKDNCR